MTTSIWDLMEPTTVPHTTATVRLRGAETLNPLVADAARRLVGRRYPEGPAVTPVTSITLTRTDTGLRVNYVPGIGLTHVAGTMTI